jgi:hypothetical protein
MPRVNPGALQRMDSTRTTRFTTLGSTALRQLLPGPDLKAEFVAAEGGTAGRPCLCYDLSPTSGAGYSIWSHRLVDVKMATIECVPRASRRLGGRASHCTLAKNYPKFRPGVIARSMVTGPTLGTTANCRS